MVSTSKLHCNDMQSVSAVSVTLTALNELKELGRTELATGQGPVTCFLWI